MDKTGLKPTEISKNWKLLLVGRDGNGKYCSAKTIENISDMGLKIKAEKCSGVGDSGEDLTEDIHAVIDNVFTKLKASKDNGEIVYIVFVLKYGVRFTKQEKDAVDVVKLMFGSDVFRQYGFIIMTYGDVFDNDNEENGRTFKDWCIEQRGDIQKLFEEVNYRIVLFDNKTKDKSKQKEQFRTLCDTVSGMKMGYGVKQFEEAREGREIIERTETRKKRTTAVESHENIDKKYNHIQKPALFKGKCFLLFSWSIVLITVAIFVLFLTEVLTFYQAVMIITLCCLLWVAVRVTMKSRGSVGLNFVNP